MKKIENSNLTKIGIVVDDIEAALQEYCILFNLEMPQVKDAGPSPKEDPVYTEESYTWYRGKMVHSRTKLATLQMGPVSLEFLQPYNEPNPWNEFKQKNGQGIHFFTFTVNGFEQHIDFMEKQGFQLAHKGEYGTGRYSYFDSTERLGVVLGIQEKGPKKQPLEDN